MKIRLAKENDVAAVKSLLDRNFNEVMTKYHSPSVIEKYKSHNSLDSLLSQLNWKKIYVAETDEGEIVATGAVANFGSPDNPKYSVSNFFVSPERHSQGIGRKLMNIILDNARSCAVETFHVPSSRNAVGFYEKMGFTVDETQPDEDDEITWMTTPL